MREIVELVARVAELERRVASMVRHGTVEAVDPSKQVVRVRMGGTDDEPFVGPWVPYGQIAGALKVHTPPSVGQQMTMLNPTGDFRQAVALPMTWSDQNASPSQKGDEHVLKFGSVTITLKGQEVTLESPRLVVKAGGSEFVVEDGKISLKSALIETDGETKLDKGDVEVVTLSGPAKRVYAKT